METAAPPLPPPSGTAAARPSRRKARQRPDPENLRTPTVPAALAEGLPASPAALRVVGCNVDTLHLFTRSNIEHRQTERLQAAQLAARERQALPGQSPGEPLDVGGVPFYVQPHGARTAPYLLDAPNVAAMLVSPQAAKGFPTLTFEVRALYLWQEGADQAVAKVAELARAMLAWREGQDANEDEPPDRLHVSRLDLAVDFQGWTPPAAEGFQDPKDETAIRYVTRAQDFAAHTVRRGFSGFMFGRGDVAARLYNKTLEAKKSGKLEAMTKVWQRAPGYDPAAPVWRLEFQLRRPAIAALRIGDKTSKEGREVSRWEDLRPNLRGLWLHLATRWLARRAPRTKTSRQALTPEWAALARDGFDGNLWAGTTEDVFRAHRQDLAERLTPQLSGYITRALAEEVFFAEGRAFGEAPATTLEDALPEIVRRVRAYATKSGKTIEEKAGDKVATWDEAQLARALAPSDDLAEDDDE